MYETPQYLFCIQLLNVYLSVVSGVFLVAAIFLYAALDGFLCIFPYRSHVIFAFSVAVIMSSYFVRTLNTLKHKWQYHKEKLNTYISLAPVNPNTSAFGLHGLIRC